jgi:hypothetical protein
MTDILTLGNLLRLARETVANPREGATTVLSFAPERQALWLMFALVVVLSLLLREVVAVFAGFPMDGPITGPMQGSTLMLGLVMAGFLFLTIHAVHRIGRFFGGTGNFEEAGASGDLAAVHPDLRAGHPDRRIIHDPAAGRAHHHRRHRALHLASGQFHRGAARVHVMYDIDKIRSDFPILSREVNGKPLVYLDNGASAQKPQVVIDAITQAYSMEYANVHRGLHYLSNLATEKYEAVRGKIARFLGVADEAEIVFTSGTTEGINLVAYGWAMPRMEAGDEIVLTIMPNTTPISCRGISCANGRAWC